MAVNGPRIPHALATDPDAAYPRRMPAYALLLTPDFAFARVHGVEAERMETVGESLHFSTGERLVYQIPARYVREVAVFDDRAEALAWLHTESRRPQGAGVLGAEQVVLGRSGRTRQVGSMVEQVAVVMEDVRRGPK